MLKRSCSAFPSGPRILGGGDLPWLKVKQLNYKYILLTITKNLIKAVHSHCSFIKNRRITNENGELLGIIKNANKCALYVLQHDFSKQYDSVKFDQHY